MKVGLAGQGAFGIKHLEAIRNIPGIEVITLTGGNQESTREVAEKFGIPHFTGDLAESLKQPGLEAMILATPPAGLAGAFATVRDSDLRRTIALIETPTLVIGGLHDTVTLASHSEAIAATIPNAELRILDGVHMLNVERPAEFLRAVTDFLLH